MPFTFQYNKTSLHEIGKALKMRHAALPVLKNKESALRAEVARYRQEFNRLTEASETLKAQADDLLPWMGAFPMKLFNIAEPHIKRRKIAGVIIPEFVSLSISIKPLLWHEVPHPYRDLVTYLRTYAEALVQESIARQQVEILERERKRTTQKVNLYEKVQIPEMEDALKKIKRFLEDEQNLAKSAQKMIKARQQSL